MLLAVDSGRLHEFKGRTLDSINVDGIINLTFIAKFTL
jgi:hypothetical protein